MLKRMGKDAVSRGWIRAGMETAENCTECGECMERCPYDLPIPELIKNNIEWFKEQMK